jgi:hypothetical protein
MSRLFFAISATIALAGTVSTAEARDHRGGSSRSSDFSRIERHDSDRRHDRDSFRYSSRRWFDEYNTYCYYCPYDSYYYFWCDDDNCYYPTSCYWSHHRR